MSDLLSFDDVRVRSTAQVNPNFLSSAAKVEALCKQHDAWLPHAAAYHSMSAYLYPDTSEERLTALNTLMNLLFFLDDCFDAWRVADRETLQTQPHTMLQQFHATVDVITTGQADVNLPWAGLCLALRQQIIEAGNPEWLPIIGTSLRHHFQAVTRPVDDIMVNGQPDVETYLAIREHDGGMHMAIDGIEFARDMHLPDSIRSHPLIQKARYHVACVGALMNDVMSYHLDEDDGNLFNLVAVLRERHNLSVEEGIHEAIVIVNHHVDCFDDCRQQLPDNTDDDTAMMHIYMNDMSYQMDATWHWQIIAQRYVSTGAYYAPLHPDNR